MASTTCFERLRGPCTNIIMTIAESTMKRGDLHAAGQFMVWLNPSMLGPLNEIATPQRCYHVVSFRGGPVDLSYSLSPTPIAGFIVLPIRDQCTGHGPRFPISVSTQCPNQTRYCTSTARLQNLNRAMAKGTSAPIKLIKP
jgi:hypothetical protein